MPRGPGNDNGACQSVQELRFNFGLGLNFFPICFTFILIEYHTHCLRRRRSKPSVWSVCELVHNIVFESRKVARTYVGVFDWLVSYAVCD